MTDSRRPGIVARARKFYRALDYSFRGQLFDRVHNVETFTRWMDRDFSATNAKHSQGYEASDAALAAKILRGLDIDHSLFSFVDVGCGKGRVLLQASRYPFREIIGVEISEALHAIALRNLAQARWFFPRCSQVSVRLQDATEFQLPAGDIVLYVFNPVDDAIMDQVLRNFSAQYRQLPRRLIMTYYNPKFRHHVFKHFPQASALYRNDYYEVYSLDGSQPGDHSEPPAKSEHAHG
jgi:SAM-dependent methyltransferase